MKLDHALSAYGQWRLANFSPATWRGEASGLRSFVGRMRDHGVYLLAEADADAMTFWWDKLTTDLGDATRATRLAQVRSFLRYCKERGWIDNDPTSLLRAPNTAPEPRDRLTAAELLSLLDVARTARDRCLLALAMNLGLRGGEIARLQMRDLMWNDGTIRVHVDKTREVDDMPITSDLNQELVRWMATYVAGHGPTPDSYLIPAQHVGAQGVSYKTTQPVREPYEVVKRALTDIGWADVKQEGVHTIRRSVARIYFDKVEAEESFDSALLATMTLLHHTRPETTLTYIGRDRATMARDRILRGQPFLSGLVGRYENPSPLASLKAVAS